MKGWSPIRIYSLFFLLFVFLFFLVFFSHFPLIHQKNPTICNLCYWEGTKGTQFHTILFHVVFFYSRLIILLLLEVLFFLFYHRESIFELKSVLLEFDFSTFMFCFYLMCMVTNNLQNFPFLLAFLDNFVASGFCTV